VVDSFDGESSLNNSYFKLSCYSKEFFIDSDNKVYYDFVDSDGNLRSLVNASVEGYFS